VAAAESETADPPKAAVEVTAEELADEEWGTVKEKGKKGKKGKGKKGKEDVEEVDEAS
jgi:translation initiation factor 5B